MRFDGQQVLPIQPVAQPILNSPYDEPERHWLYDPQTGVPSVQPGRRDAFYWYKTARTGSAQQALFAEESRDDLPLVNKLRADVRRWREGGYEKATPVTKKLLRHWSREDLPRRLFFCQREAVETIIYLSEVLSAGGPRFTPELRVEDYQRLVRGEEPDFVQTMMGSLVPTLLDLPADPSLPGLHRYGCKMATGSGKTVVMAMLIAWAFCNRGRSPSDERFPRAALVVCPNLTVKERLQVLRPDRADNYYREFDLIPSQFIPELQKGRVLITNWHAFLPESPRKHDDGKTYQVVDKGEESADAFAKKRLEDLYDAGNVMVLNDEAHHAYRPKSMEERERGESKDDWLEATVWVSGLDRINEACGIAFCVDLSATPFYLSDSGYAEGTPFPWLVSDFGLVDAIESGITKIPRLPVSDTTGRPEPQFFALWQHVKDNLQPGEKLPGGKPKPEAVWREAQAALATLAAQWKERFDYYREAAPGQERIPPVLIVVCDNTDIAELFYEKISGELRRGSETAYTSSAALDEFANDDTFKPTVRIDSKLLAEAESEETGKGKSDAAEALRQIVATVGKPGQPGERVRCVVSVQMLTEGWDANNVTHILGLRAFDSQLLCEQVVGRGLRRMDYTPDPTTGRLSEEYVDVYGIPFSVIPFKGREAEKKAPEDKPKNHIVALPERAAFEIRFPVVEGYAFALKQNLIRADVDAIEQLVISPEENPTAAFVMPQVGYQAGRPGAPGMLDVKLHNRQAYYEEHHLQTIQFEIARQVVNWLTIHSDGEEPKLPGRSRYQLFPQVYRLVESYIRRRVRFRDVDRRELGLEKYSRLVVERLVDAIEPDDTAGEPPLLPVVNRFKPTGTTAEVSFKTTKPCYPARFSHINQVVADTVSWEQSAAFRLEQAVVEDVIQCYAKNDGVELAIPYEYLSVNHAYYPDFIVRMADDSMLLVETKGRETEQDRAKHEAAKRWCRAVTRWGQHGRWNFLPCYNPQELPRLLRSL